MKKLFCLYILFFNSIFGFSQNSNLKYGLQGGLNYSDFRGFSIDKDYYYEKPSVAFLAGINIEYLFNEKLSLKFEINFEQKKQKENNKRGIYSFDKPDEIFYFNSWRIQNYLSIPILFKYKFKNYKNIYLNGGPFIGYLLESKITNNLNNSEYESDPIDNKYNYKETDLGITFGIGKEFEITKKSDLFLELRNNLGLKNLTIIPYNKPNGKFKTNSVNLIVGLSFN